jgi:hypothetical protein
MQQATVVTATASDLLGIASLQLLFLSQPSHLTTFRKRQPRSLAVYCDAFGFLDAELIRTSAQSPAF